MNKKYIYLISVLIIFAALFPLSFGKCASDALKGDIIKGLDNTMDQSGLGDKKMDVKDMTTEKTSNEVSVLIGKILRIFVLAFLGATFLEMTIYGGYLWLTSGGNEEQIAKAKKIITSAAVGMFLILSAYAITYFVMYNLAHHTGNNVPVETPSAAAPAQESNAAPAQEEPLFDDDLGTDA